MGEERGWEAFKLPAYNGNGDLEEWLCKMEAFFDFTGKPQAQRVLYASNKLAGKAHSRFRSIKPVPSSWESFKAAMRLVRDPVQEQGEMSVAEFTKEFMTMYLSGLRPDVQVAVKKGGPRNFEDAISLALAFENRGEDSSEDGPKATEGKKSPTGKLAPETTAIVPPKAAAAAAAPKVQAKRMATTSVSKEQTPVTAREVPSKAGATAAAARASSLPSAARVQSPSPAASSVSNEEVEESSEDDEEEDEEVEDIRQCMTVYTKDDDYGYYFRGTVNGHKVNFAQSNSSDNLITEALVKRLGLKTVKCGPFFLKVSKTVSSRCYDRMVTGLEYEIEGGLKNRMDFAVVHKLPRHEIMLGWPFFGHVNETVIFTSGARVLVGPHVLQLYTGPPA